MDSSLHPKAIIVFGSYSRGEDIETSDIDLIVVSKIKKNINFSKLEKLFKRNINMIIIEDLKMLDNNIRKKALNGIVIHGGI